MNSAPKHVKSHNTNNGECIFYERLLKGDIGPWGRGPHFSKIYVAFKPGPNRTNIKFQKILGFGTEILLFIEATLSVMKLIFENYLTSIFFLSMKK